MIDMKDIAPTSDTRTFAIDATGQVLNSSRIGIEIEAEGIGGKSLRHIKNSGLWNVVNDPSLRDGMEFVSLPIMGKDIITALDFIDDKCKDFTFGERTSVHIHVNIQDLNVENLFTFIHLYILFEHSIFKYIGRERDKCIYCNPIYNSRRSQKQINRVVRALDSRKTSDVINRWSKYHAMNICSVGVLGTVEFRHMYGTGNKQEILDWINILLSFKMWAVANSGKDLVGYTSEVGVKQLVEEVIGTKSPLAPHCTNKNVYKGVRTLQDIVNFHKFDAASSSIYGCEEGESIAAKIKDKSAVVIWNKTKDKESIPSAES